MQSPFVSASHPQSPYGMAQMFLTSPSSSNSDQHAGSYVAYDYRQQRKYNVVTGPNGLLTPGWLAANRNADSAGPSGEMLPELRLDLMSPMQLEMLSRGDMIEGMENVSGMVASALTSVPCHASAVTSVIPAHKFKLQLASGAGCIQLCVA